MTINMAGYGWYDFIKQPEATTHIIYVSSNGEHYIPEEGVKVKDFLDALMFERAWKLIRDQDNNLVRAEATVQTWPKLKY